MKAKCIDAVERALGRKLNADEAREIEDRITASIRRMARRDPEGTMRMPEAKRLREAAKLAAQDIIAEAELDKHRMALQILAMDRVRTYVDDQAALGVDRVDAASRLLAPRLDGQDNVQSVETRSIAIRRTAYAQLSGEIERLGPKFLGLVDDVEGGKALIRELKGEDSGVAVAKSFAAKWKTITSAMREAFNAAGGKIRYLEDWGFPQHHSQFLIAEAGISRWVQTGWRLLDRGRYFDDAGRPMSDDLFRVFLETSYRSLATGGLLDAEPGKVRSMVANRHAAARQLHFKSAEAYIEYHAQFGEKTLIATLLDHIDGLSRDLALVEKLGPNPEHQFAVLLKKSVDAEAGADPRRTGKLQKEAAVAERLYNEVAGAHPQAGSVRLAKGFDTLRNWLVASRLGTAVITSFSDEATMHLTAQINHLPELQMFRNELKLLNPASAADRALLRRAGLGLETLIGSINRSGQEHLFSGMSQRVASFTIRASGLNFMTDVRRQAFGATMMDAIGSLTRTVEGIAALDKGDHRMLLAKGITDTDWNVWRAAELEDWGAGNGLLTPEAILRIPDAKLAGLGGDPATLRREAALKLLGAVSEEVDMAVIQPGARERVIMHSDLARGTWKGELVRSAFLFKSFPIAMLYRHWTRAMELPNAGTALYLATLMAGTTVLGMLSLQVNEMISGRDPKNMNPFEGKAGVKNWFAAMAKGGSLGLYGDFLYSQQTRGERGAVASLLGPVVGLGEELIGLTQGNLVQLAQGKDTHAGAELVRFGRGLTPNTWYTKAAMDHLIFHQLQEMASPGYLGKMRSRAEREFGQRYWWEPGQAIPQREPRMEAAIGR